MTKIRPTVLRFGIANNYETAEIYFPKSPLFMIEQFCQRLMLRLQARGHRVFMYPPKDSYDSLSHIVYIRADRPEHFMADLVELAQPQYQGAAAWALLNCDGQPGRASIALDAFSCPTISIDIGSIRDPQIYDVEIELDPYMNPGISFTIAGISGDMNDDSFVHVYTLLAGRIVADLCRQLNLQWSGHISHDSEQLFRMMLPA